MASNPLNAISAKTASSPSTKMPSIPDESFGEDELTQKQQSMYEKLIDFLHHHGGDANDEVFQTCQSAAEALQRCIRYASERPRGPRAPTSFVPQPLRSDVRAEQAEVIRTAILGVTWSDDYELSGPSELPDDDLDDAEMTSISASVDSEYGGSSALCRTFISTEQTSRTGVLLGTKGKGTHTVSSSAGTTHTRPVAPVVAISASAPPQPLEEDS